MSFLPELVQHLWVSTLFLAVLLAAVFLLRGRLTAGARFMLALIGVLKFAVPAGLLMSWMVRLFEPDSRAAFALPVKAAGVLRLDVAPAAPQSIWPQMAVGLWLGVAALIVLRYALTRHRLVRLAEQTAVPATPREVAALNRARLRAGVRRSIDVVRSGVSEAPAVLRTIRPMVVLPAGGCDDLSDEELEALLCHECAHVRRYDNLIARVESFLCALFWFHPLLWIAQRITALERERACDEAVAESADERETYLAALAKFCHAAIAPRLPGVSCMATARLKERMDHVENYERLKAHSPSPRRMAAISVAALAVYTIVAGIATDNRALAVTAGGSDAPYAIKITAVRDGDTVDLQGRVTDNASGRVVAMPKVTFAAGETATARAGNTADAIDVTFQVRPDSGRRFAVDVTVDRSGAARFQHTLMVTPSEAAAATKYDGAPISLELKQADIRDVLRTFGQLTGMNMQIGEEVTGKVTVSWTGVPWDQAFEEMLREHGLTHRIEGSTIHIEKP
jgi:beta-lactamase regulating signal transducer with metallopeptidase domain